jgi:hypothetical protein
MEFWPSMLPSEPWPPLPSMNHTWSLGSKYPYLAVPSIGKLGIDAGENTDM